jgi:hypothetical protein
MILRPYGTFLFRILCATSIMSLKGQTQRILLYKNVWLRK